MWHKTSINQTVLALLKLEVEEVQVQMIIANQIQLLIRLRSDFVRKNMNKYLIRFYTLIIMVETYQLSETPIFNIQSATDIVIFQILLRSELHVVPEISAYSQSISLCCENKWFR